jgi:Pretoxin HINT domain
MPVNMEAKFVSLMNAFYTRNGADIRDNVNGDWLAGWESGGDIIMLLAEACNEVGRSCTSGYLGALTTLSFDFAPPGNDRAGAAEGAFRSGRRNGQGSTSDGTAGATGQSLQELQRSGCLNSFPGGTQVLMADGASKLIDQVKVGDTITDAEPGALPGTLDQHHVVTAVHVTRTDRDYTAVTIDTGHGPATITSTAHHLYWDATTRTWTEADHLHPGDQLQTTNGNAADVAALHNYTATTTTYNLTIDNLHTYYVEAGTTPVLVHNSGPCDEALPFGPGRPEGTGEGWTARTADNGKGMVWQAPGATGNADMVRIMNPTARYPDGYVRFYNDHGQPIGPDGKPGPNSLTHIPMGPGGTYPLPSGWSW